ncbi:WD repeat-containing protein DWA2-like isoform X2 [Populus nigra]|uniref:WD repeat-containing protein DWA2-like isoform X2 n=1 Tax=Populus nigra TaxID=3691 RepID=UPI002B272195|nr:WD repeat-containing protein DWA2-like isoform X2 [Populus nigra]
MQGGSTGIGYGLKYQARCISDVKADTDHTSFITGTLSLGEENEVHLLRLSAGGTELICEGLFSHPEEIWNLSSCPFDQRVFSTVFSAGESFGAAVWQIPELYGQLNSPQLERIASLDGHVGKHNCVLWWPSGRNDKLISIDQENIFLWSLDCSRQAAQVQSKESAGMLHYLSGGAWDPHDVNAVAATCESSVQFWDLRAMKKTNSIECGHVLNVDYDTRKKHILVTAEDESGIHIWDLRMPNVPVKELRGHSHWTWAVACNPEYDGLILRLWNTGSIKNWSQVSLFLGCLCIINYMPCNKAVGKMPFHLKSFIVWMVVMITKQVTLSLLAILFINIFLTKGKLLQSGGSDSTVNLWFASTTTSDELTSESVLKSPTRELDSLLLNSFSDYDDSVYGLAWSSQEPWIFASLSYDGRVVVESIKPYLPKK